MLKKNQATKLKLLNLFFSDFHCQYPTKSILYSKTKNKVSHPTKKDTHCLIFYTISLKNTFNINKILKVCRQKRLSIEQNVRPVISGSDK